VCVHVCVCAGLCMRVCVCVYVIIIIIYNSLKKYLTDEFTLAKVTCCV
jgi:hypothetical protein